MKQSLTENVREQIHDSVCFVWRQGNIAENGAYLRLHTWREAMCVGVTDIPEATSAQAPELEKIVLVTASSPDSRTLTGT